MPRRDDGRRRGGDRPRALAGRPHRHLRSRGDGCGGGDGRAHTDGPEAPPRAAADADRLHDPARHHARLTSRRRDRSVAHGMPRFATEVFTEHNATIAATTPSVTPTGAPLTSRSRPPRRLPTSATAAVSVFDTSPADRGVARS